MGASILKSKPDEEEAPSILGTSSLYDTLIQHKFATPIQDAMMDLMKGFADPKGSDIRSGPPVFNIYGEMVENGEPTWAALWRDKLEREMWKAINSRQHNLQGVSGRMREDTPERPTQVPVIGRRG